MASSPSNKIIHLNKDSMNPKLAPYGYAFLGRDKKTWGLEGTGVETIDPDFEGKPHYNDRVYDPLNDPIHLSIASFRDRLCPRTLFNLFHKAANPKRIYVRLIQQLEYESPDIDDADCWEQFCQQYKDQIDCHLYESQLQLLTMNAKSAKGPTDPRSKLSQMLIYDYLHPKQPMLVPVDPNHYCMQTDSHMDFNQDFDVGMIEMFHRTRNDYAVLSTYVAPMEQTDQNPKNVPHLCMVEYTVTWRNWGTKYCEHIVRPKLTNIPWGAGLSFQKCHADLNVPYDPYLSGMFDGEELSRGYRFFTHGYDIYTPDQVLVTHDYEGHQHNPHVHTWGGGAKQATKPTTARDSNMSLFMHEIEALRESVQPRGIKRINIMMGLLEPDEVKGADGKKKNTMLLEKISNSRYGMGDRRSLEQANEFSGFDPKQRKMVKNRCGNIAWVPYEEDENYGLDKYMNRAIWGEKKSKKKNQNKAEKQKKEKSKIKSNNKPPLDEEEFSVSPMSKSGVSQASADLATSRRLHGAPKIGAIGSGNSDGISFISMMAVVVFAVVGIAMAGRRRIYSACKPKKTARMVL